MPSNLEEQLIQYLTDAHSIEEQALAQLRSAPDAAGQAELARVFREHLTETEEHERLVRSRLEAHDAAPSRVKDIAGKVGGFAFILFAKSQPDTPGKLAGFAFAFEHLEIAGYELLKRVAQRAGDTTTAELAESIAGEERVAAGKIASTFDGAIEASLQAQGVRA